MDINISTNFMRIFRMPSEYPSGFCFGGGRPVTFLMVDWFNPVPLERWKGFDPIPHRERIRNFIRQKMYYDPDYTYLAVAEYGDAFLISGPRPVDAEAQEEAAWDEPDPVC